MLSDLLGFAIQRLKVCQAAIHSYYQPSSFSTDLLCLIEKNLSDDFNRYEHKEKLVILQSIGILVIKSKETRVSVGVDD